MKPPKMKPCSLLKTEIVGPLLSHNVWKTKGDGKEGPRVIAGWWFLKLELVELLRYFQIDLSWKLLPFNPLYIKSTAYCEIINLLLVLPWKTVIKWSLTGGGNFETSVCDPLSFINLRTIVPMFFIYGHAITLISTVTEDSD